VERRPRLRGHHCQRQAITAEAPRAGDRLHDQRAVADIDAGIEGIVLEQWFIGGLGVILGRCEHRDLFGAVRDAEGQALERVASSKARDGAAVLDVGLVSGSARIRRSGEVMATR
jgi:hypothetical protein